jgi:transcriptional regulator with XRE-family HTH domain
MNNLTELSDVIRARMHQTKSTYASLSSAAGIANGTLGRILSGEHDFRINTLFAIADRLGLEVLLVPKGAAAAIGAPEEPQPAVPSVVDRALGRDRSS